MTAQRDSRWEQAAPLPLPVAVGVEQAAALLGITPLSLRSLVRRGEVKCLHIREKVLFRMSSLEDYVQQQEALEGMGRERHR